MPDFNGSCRWLTWAPRPGQLGHMFDEDGPRKKSDVLAELGREDLDKLSIAELDDRIAALEAEAARARAKRVGAAAFRSAADGLFKR